MTSDISTSLARAPDVPERPEFSFLQKSLPVYAILGTFVVVTVPLAVMAGTDPDFFNRYGRLVWLYICCFSTTHFVLTLTVYMQSSNLRYFRSTWTNCLIYFFVPISIFILFDMYSALQIAVLFPIFDKIFRFGIRFFDFHHFNRQNFGVLQLFKARSKGRFPAWLKTAENGYFFCLSLWLMQTFLNGGQFHRESQQLAIFVSVVGCLLLVVLFGFAKAWVQSTDRSALLVPFGYFVFQSASAALAIHSTALYFFTLAMHYVEYHVLMMPRCFKSTLDHTSRIDRIFARLRSNKLFFYGILFAMAVWVTNATLSSSSLSMMEERPGTFSYQFLLGLFDGLFVFHYFIESFIWKFSQPYYRQSLVSLYFGPSVSRPTPVPT